MARRRSGSISSRARAAWVRCSPAIGGGSRRGAREVDAHDRAPRHPGRGVSSAARVVQAAGPIARCSARHWPRQEGDDDDARTHHVRRARHRRGYRVRRPERAGAGEEARASPRSGPMLGGRSGWSDGAGGGGSGCSRRCSSPAATSIAARPRARQRLGGREARGELWASLARGTDQEIHGAPQGSRVRVAYVAALVAAHASLDPLAPLAAWYAVHHLLGLRAAVQRPLRRSTRSSSTRCVREPGKLGWRAAAELVEWSIAETFDRAETTGDAYDALVKKRSGWARALLPARRPCASGTAPTSIAAGRSTRRSWPLAPLVAGRFAPRLRSAPALHTEQPRCAASGDAPARRGRRPSTRSRSSRRAAIAHPRHRHLRRRQASVVDMPRSGPPRTSLDDWGDPRLATLPGAAVHVAAGRHRVLARLHRRVGDGKRPRLKTSTARPPRRSPPARDARRPLRHDAPPRALQGRPRTRSTRS